MVEYISMLFMSFFYISIFFFVIIIPFFILKQYINKKINFKGNKVNNVFCILFSLIFYFILYRFEILNVFGVIKSKSLSNLAIEPIIIAVFTIVSLFITEVIIKYKKVRFIYLYLLLIEILFVSMIYIVFPFIVE
ncbi:MAG: hypothetical protein A2015_11300 [Spirochaetes bacterium GWF1_31_7]|nr:MAG: hypothetical protein A2Y30_02535 [Spirochaetes bacterium GWE1_32_154]OHD46829.1 MAG: hypothetical protein A2Y29_09850 [Spirochaetes bacterium GWE2_31_10]OHD47784.1 MAG: hypothetical protein A2015_11300 [Spirochaetes bacterium GWF1_31_7]OHD75335.1 MAG: hypothetical protein A2355_03415 [Spirochaetes bacterium RIFOXYB1_FULL_32_8]HBD95639.1 hypothetical protein [Spirochaetia bacterium]